MSVVVDMDDYRRTRQLENGYTRIADEILDDLVIAPLTARQFRLVLAIIRKTYGFNKREDRIALSQLVEATGIDKGNCSRTLAELIGMNVIIRTGNPAKLRYNKYAETWDTTAAESRINRKREVMSNARQNIATTPTTQTPKVAIRGNPPETPKVAIRGNPPKNPKSCYSIATKSCYSWQPQKTINKRLEEEAEQTADAVRAAESAQPRPTGEPAVNQNAALQKTARCPYDDLAALYTTHFANKRQPRTLSSRRKAILLKGWRHGLVTQKRDKSEMLYTDTESGLVFWDRFMAHIAKNCQFCMQAQTNFDIEWLFSPRAIDNIIDGKYDTVHDHGRSPT